MIRTNRFIVEYNREAIDRDFDVLLIEKSKDLYRTNILDEPVLEYKARAVQYSFGNKYLVLFKKNEGTRNFISALMREYPDVKVKQVDVLDEKECQKVFFYQNRLLLQLLVNSLQVPKRESFSYNNLTGKLYYRDPSWEWKNKETKETYGLYLLQIVFSPGMYLNLEVKTFRKKTSPKEENCYCMDPATGVFRKKLKSDKLDVSKLFVKDAFEGHKNRIKFLDFSSYDKFRKSKMGIMERFLQDVQTKLSDYVTLRPTIRDDKVYVLGGKTQKEKAAEWKNYLGILAENGVNLVDECQNNVSRECVEYLVNELQSTYGLEASVGPLSVNKYNIRIIHDDEYYSDNQLDDRHDDELNGYIVQHLTLEEWMKLDEDNKDQWRPIIHKALLELILKGDVFFKRVRITNWTAHSFGKTWTFVQRTKLDEKEENDEVINVVGRKVQKRYIYYLLRIDEYGKMEFDHFSDLDLPANAMEERIRYVYETYEASLRGAQKPVEALVFSDIDNMHVIVRTQEKTMPNTTAIWEGLKATRNKDSLIPEVIWDAIVSFQEDYPQYEAYGTGLKAELMGSLNEKKTLTKVDMRKAMNLRSNAGVTFNRYLHENYDIWISAEMKSSQVGGQFELENVIGIKYFYEENTDGKGIRSFNYYAGTPGRELKQSVRNACVVRQVLAEGNIEFEELLPLMAVDFVRVGMYTVLPFPFKYLNEYRRSMEDELGTKVNSEYED